MTSAMVRVALPLRLPRLFDYLVPGEVALPPVGARVLVPFRNRDTVALVVSHPVHTQVPASRLRSIRQILAPSQWFTPELWKLALWAADYYHHPLGEVLFTMLPATLRKPGEQRSGEPLQWELTAAGSLLKPEGLPGSAVVQARVLARLSQGPLAVDEVRLLGNSFAGALRRMAAKGLVARVPAKPASPPPPADPLKLSDEQQQVLETIAGQAPGFQAMLLDGVTGSGKTEVYLRAIERIVAEGGQALVLVPEIGLTPQLRRRFERRFGRAVGVVHSGMTNNERHGVAAAAAAGRLGIVVGTRSAIFTPFADLQMICIDEEHDLSYKQADGWRYSARDLGVRRAQMSGIPIILGSATPSLESLKNVLRGRYLKLSLTQRPGEARQPELLTVDLRRQFLEQGLSRRLLEIMDKTLERRQQCLLFINRRGFAPIMLCQLCGWHATCARCDANQTYHQTQERLQCHHCGAARRVPKRCPDCGAPHLHVLGEGTQRLEQAVAEQFPAYRVLRVDRDSTRRRGSLETLLERASSGEPCILIGTQMLAKGHDFPKVTLAALVNVDQALFSADFRATERLAQLIVQVAGRSGRGTDPGLVVLQTWQPEHPIFEALRDGGYQKIAATLLDEREQARLPPFSASALLRSEATQLAVASRFLEEAREVMQADDIELLGPVPAPMEKRAGRFRQQMLLLAPDRGTLHRHLKQHVEGLYTLPAASKVRWSLDVDPLDLG